MKTQVYIETLGQKPLFVTCAKIMRSSECLETTSEIANADIVVVILRYDTNFSSLSTFLDEVKSQGKPVMCVAHEVTRVPPQIERLCEGVKDVRIYRYWFLSGLRGDILAECDAQVEKIKARLS